jgi:hypothetical protein
MSGVIEISVGDVTDIEERVYARYRPVGDAPSQVVLTGRLRGPFCEKARTLAADFKFQLVNADAVEGVVAEAVVTDPCMWTEDMPHYYQVDVEAQQGNKVVAEYHGQIGLRRLAPRRAVDFAPGTG